MVEISEVLKYVNSARNALGRSTIDHLPKGEQFEGDLCPIAKALEVTHHVDCSVIEFEDDEDAIKVNLAWYGYNLTKEFQGTEIIPPPIVANFILEFDSSKYPELIEEKGSETE